MNGSELAAISPLIILALTPVCAMLVLAFRRSHSATALISLAGLAAAGGALYGILDGRTIQATSLIVFDPFAAVFTGLLLPAAGLTILLAWPYLKTYTENREEFYILLLLATLGATVLAWSTHFATFFLGFELLSVSLYALIAYPRTFSQNIEAGLKYLILAAASSAFLLFGMALLYAGSGNMEFGQIGKIMRYLPQGPDGVILLSGAALLVVGIAFKLALVPFHWWAADVYQGAPAPVAGFVASVSKGGIVALLVRLFFPMGIHPGGVLFLIFALIAAASMIAGNLLALLQNNVKRILAYSSIAHMGYLMVAFLAAGPLAKTAVAFYLAAYFVTILGAFGVITLISEPGREAEEIADFRGLFRTRPWLAAIFAVMLFSLAGIPLTAGFLGKVYVMAAGVDGARWALLVILVVGSTIGLFYYLRIISALFADIPELESLRPFPPVSIVGGFALWMLLLMLFWLGTYPIPMLRIFQAAFG